MKSARRALVLFVLGLAALLCLPATASAATATTPGSPHGALDSIGRVPAGVRVTGWAVDPDTTEPITVHLYDNGVAVAATSANMARPDVAAAMPGFGENHGLDFTFDALEGSHTICAYAINVGPGANTLLGCRALSFSHRPQGSLDVFTRGLGGLHVAGWAVDPDTVAPVDVHAYSGTDFLTAASATGARPDVATFLPSYGPEHGFDLTIPLPAGVTRVCLYALDNAGQTNALLGCGQISADPGLRGAVDALDAVPGGVHVGGWALDLDVADPIAVHLYADGHFLAAVTAGENRADVGRAYPGFGDLHGFDATVAIAAGTHQVCAYAINAGPGTGNRTLGCRAIAVP